MMGMRALLAITANANAVSHAPATPWERGRRGGGLRSVTRCAVHAPPETRHAGFAGGTRNIFGGLLNVLRRWWQFDDKANGGGSENLHGGGDSDGNGHGNEPGGREHHGDGSVKRTGTERPRLRSWPSVSFSLSVVGYMCVRLACASVIRSRCPPLLG